MSNNPGLSYEDTPPFSAPLRFFLTAPLFGVALGVLLLLDPGLLDSRWSPGALAAVHLLAAGFMLQVMIGALQQIMPVVAGAQLPRPLLIAGLTHPLSSLGALALASGLGLMLPALIIGGALLLVSGLLVFLVGAGLAILRSPRLATASHTPRDLRLALAGLAITLSLGLLLAFSLAQGLNLPFVTLSFADLVDLHASWGVLGWASLLLAATSWVVVPMFQITPSYPGPFGRWYAPGLFAALLLWSGLRIAEQNAAWLILGLLLLAAITSFAVITLRLQARTRRSKPDASFRAFRVAMFAFASGTLILASNAVHDHPLASVLAAILILHGGFGGAISSMLYKIVPFLSWLHLSQAGIKRPPSVKKLLPDSRIQRQLRVHHLSLALLCLASLLSAFAPAGTSLTASLATSLITRLAGLALIAEFGWLLHNIWHTLSNWQQARLLANTAPAGPAGPEK